MSKKDQFAGEGYTIYIEGKNLEITDAIRKYIAEKLARIERVTDQIIDVRIVLDVQKLEHSCSMLMDFIHFHVKATASTDNIYSAIDKAVDRLITLIRRYKSKMQSHRGKDLTTIDIHVNVIRPLADNLQAINDDIEAENARELADTMRLHPIVAKETMQLKTLTQDEAVMKMECTGDHFLIYKGEEDQKLKLIYRRDDQDYGLVQIQS